MNQEEILKQAKAIIDNFHSALKDVEKLEESRVERDECERVEKEGDEPNGEFRKIMFSNFRNKDISESDRKSGDFRHALRTKDECIEAERGKWL